MEFGKGDNWYQIKIFNKEVNWASVVVSGIIFIGLEIYRRKYIEKKIKEDIKIALSQSKDIQKETKSLLDELINRI